MRKISAVLLAFTLLFLCACSDKADDRLITADMLSITNTDKDFQGCLSRMEAVISAMSAKISILEEAHNAVIRSENKDEYFFDENYILTSFEPFITETLSITEGFTADMTNRTAQDFYKLQSEGMDITFNSDGNNYELTFVSETTVKSYTAEYDEETDSLRYTYSVENGDEETVEEFIEFSKTESGAYVIQSRFSRCYIEFNKNDEIVYFCCGTLYEGEFTTEESIYPETENELDGYWVISRGKSLYSGIHTFENNELIHEDRSGGPWKTVRINGENFASAFLK